MPRMSKKAHTSNPREKMYVLVRNDWKIPAHLRYALRQIILHGKKPHAVYCFQPIASYGC